MDQTYELIDHTADIGALFYGDTLEDLFANAGLALSAIMVDVPPETGADTRPLTIDAADREDLLVRFLAELVYIFQVDEMVAAGVRVGRVTDTEITAEVDLAPFDLETHGLNHEIKAVTYHDLFVEPVPGGWRARVIFDL